MLGTLHKVRGAVRSALRGIAAICEKLPMEKIGCYAALIALLAALGSASYAWRNRSPEDDETATRAVSAIQTATPVSAPTPRPTPEPMRFCRPLEGDIVGEYAPDRLVWSPTLGQWQTHPGIDITGMAGEAVYACADGVVRDRWQDPLWGNVILIAHEGGYISTYAGLNTLNMVETGEAVAMGDVIGAAGESAVCEAELGCHVHFELEKDGESVDSEALMASLP